MHMVFLQAQDVIAHMMILLITQAIYIQFIMDMIVPRIVQ